MVNFISWFLVPTKTLHPDDGSMICGLRAKVEHKNQDADWNSLKFAHQLNIPPSLAYLYFLNC